MNCWNAALKRLTEDGGLHFSSPYTERVGSILIISVLVMYVRFSVLLLLVALAQSYIWTRKKVDDPAGPQEIQKPRRRPGPGSKYVKKSAFANTDSTFVSANVSLPVPLLHANRNCLIFQHLILF